MSLIPIRGRLHVTGSEGRFWGLMHDHCENTSRAEAWSFETWDAILDAAVEHGVAAIETDRDGEPMPSFIGPFGYALLRRFRWLRDVRRRGLTPAQAEAEFSRQIDASRASAAAVQEQAASSRAQRIAQQSGRRRGVEAEL